MNTILRMAKDLHVGNIIRLDTADFIIKEINRHEIWYEMKCKRLNSDDIPEYSYFFYPEDYIPIPMYDKPI